MAIDDQRFSLTPTFIGWITVLYLLPLQLFFAAWSGVFFGSIMSWLQILPEARLMLFAVPGLITFFLILIVGYISKKLIYSHTEYRVYPDRLEFEGGFLARNRKTLRFRDVREVTLHKGLLQRMCGLGTIYLGSVATGTVLNLSPFSAIGLGNVSASGIAIRDISNSDEAFKKLQTHIDASNKTSSDNNQS
jgi:membrane protein YdbS with pleckstrin-like domain